MILQDEEEVTCICKEPNGNSFMICCDECDDWYHGECVQVTPTLAKQLDIIGYEWICPCAASLLITCFNMIYLLTCAPEN